MRRFLRIALALVIEPDGDVYVFDPLNLGLNPFWDCPPYNNS